MYRWWPKKILDPPWTGWLGIAIQATSALIVTNATIVFILAVISSIAVDLSPNKADEKFIQGHIMLVRAELIFFYCTIPLVYIATNVIENFCLWNNRLEPLYVIVAAVIAINIWVLQMTIWGPCIFAGGKDGVDGPGYCPYMFRSPRVSLDELQAVGDPRMAFYAVPTLFILYIAYLTLGAIGKRREKKKPQRTDSFNLPKFYTYSSQVSDTEAIPFRNSWESRGSPSGDVRDTDSLTSPKTRQPLKIETGDSESSTPPKQEPAIALTLTTPHGTNEEHGSFDDDRLSRLGFRAY